MDSFVGLSAEDDRRRSLKLEAFNINTIRKKIHISLLICSGMKSGPKPNIHTFETMENLKVTGKARLLSARSIASL